MLCVCMSACACAGVSGACVCARVCVCVCVCRRGCVRVRVRVRVRARVCSCGCSCVLVQGALCVSLTPVGCRYAGCPVTLWPPQAVAGVVGALLGHTETNIQKRTYKKKDGHVGMRLLLWHSAGAGPVRLASTFGWRTAHKKRTYKKDRHVGLGPLLRRSAGAGPVRLAAASSSSGCGIMHAMHKPGGIGMQKRREMGPLLRHLTAPDPRQKYPP